MSDYDCDKCTHAPVCAWHPGGEPEGKCPHYEVKDPMGEYLRDLEFAKANCRETIKEMIKMKVEPIQVYIYCYKNFNLMVPVNEALQPVQIIGDWKKEEEDEPGT